MKILLEASLTYEVGDDYDLNEEYVHCLDRLEAELGIGAPVEIILTALEE